MTASSASNVTRVELEIDGWGDDLNGAPVERRVGSRSRPRQIAGELYRAEARTWVRVARKTFRLALVLLVPAVASSACGSDTTGPSDQIAEIRFTAQPTDAMAGAVISPVVQIVLLDGDGNRVTSADVEVGVQIGTNVGGGRLSGTTRVTATNGVASFADLSIDKAGSGYALLVSLADMRDTSTTFTINPASPFQLSFVSQPVVDTARRTIAPFVVEIQDRFRNRIEGATDVVAVAFDANPGALIFHASGASADSSVLQYVDPLTPEVLSGLPASQASEITGMTYDAMTGKVLAVEIGTELLEIDPLSGAAATIGGHGVVPLRGLTWEQGGAERLLASHPHRNELYELSPTTATATLLGGLDIANDSVLGINGLATDPSDGSIYAIVRLRDTANRRMRELVTVDVNARVVTRIGTLSEEGVASLAFYPDGALYAATGDGGTNPESLWSVDKTDASMRLIIPMGDGNAGEAIAYIPAHLSGTLVVTAVEGVAVFNELLIDAQAEGYTLVATAPGLSPAVSVPFDIIRP